MVSLWCTLRVKSDGLNTVGVVTEDTDLIVCVKVHTIEFRNIAGNFGLGAGLRTHWFYVDESKNLGLQGKYCLSLADAS